jgi:hypothetical protein
VKTVLRICLLLILISAGLPTEAEACCAVSDTPQCEMNIDYGDHHDDPCDDDSCHCICCGTVTMVCWNELLAVHTPRENIIETPKSFISLFDHLFTTSIWQPPK